MYEASNSPSSNLSKPDGPIYPGMGLHDYARELMKERPKIEAQPLPSIQEYSEQLIHKLFRMESLMADQRLLLLRLGELPPLPPSLREIGAKEQPVTLPQHLGLTVSGLDRLLDYLGTVNEFLHRWLGPRMDQESNPNR